jgi:hypothetical protein
MSIELRLLCRKFQRDERHLAVLNVGGGVLTGSRWYNMACGSNGIQTRRRQISESTASPSPKRRPCLAIRCRSHFSILIIQQPRIVTSLWDYRVQDGQKETSMKIKQKNEGKDTLRTEYDFTRLKLHGRGRYAKRYREGTNLVLLAPDVAHVFPDAASVNEALRTLMRIGQLRAQ